MITMLMSKKHGITMVKKKKTHCITTVNAQNHITIEIHI